jgi:hypothetical protein
MHAKLLPALAQTKIKARINLTDHEARNEVYGMVRWPNQLPEGSESQLVEPRLVRRRREAILAGII